MKNKLFLSLLMSALIAQSTVMTGYAAGMESISAEEEESEEAEESEDAVSTEEEGESKEAEDTEESGEVEDSEEAKEESEETEETEDTEESEESDESVQSEETEDYEQATVLGDPPDAPGGSSAGGSSSSSSIVWSGAKTITSATTETGQTYSSTTASENAVLIETSDAVSLINPTVEKTGADSSNGGDNDSFYGTNSAVMCMGGGTTTISGAKVTTDAKGANGVFSFGGNATTNATSGDGTTVDISDSTITTTGDGSGGIMTTGQGITKASDLTINTSGASSAAIRSDRGGGTVDVDGGTYTTSGVGSPAVYATATINVSNATLKSTASQGIVNEGGNTVVLSNCVVDADNSERNSQDKFNEAVFLYQSMSGDATDGASVFKMTDGTLKNTTGHVFHVTNTSAAITLEGVDIVNNDSDNVLLSVCDDAWSGLSNKATLNANNQTLEGKLLVGSGDTLSMNLSGTSVWTGTTSGAITSHSNESISSSLGTVDLKLSDTALVVLDADTTVSSISGTGLINYNGHTLTVNGTSYNSGSPGVSTITVSDETAADRDNGQSSSSEGGSSSETQTKDIAKLYSAKTLTVSGVSAKTYNYGAAIEQSPVIKVGSTTLVKGTDYTLSYSNNKNAGTATMTITGKGSYTGTQAINFKINALSVAASKIATTLKSTGYTYTGKNISPAVSSVVIGNKTLTKNTDYTISYPTSRKNVGRYAVTIKLKGNYSGTDTAYYSINPKGTTLKSLTAGSKKLTVKWKKQAAKMSTSTITGYQLRYSTSSGFKSGVKTATVKGASKVSKTLSNLKAKKRYYVQIRTYKKVGTRTFYSVWSKSRYKTTTK